MRLLVLILAVMFNSSLVLGAGDPGGRRDRAQKEEDEEIVEVLEILEEYELLQGMEVLETGEIEGKDKPNPEKDKESEKDTP